MDKLTDEGLIRVRDICRIITVSVWGSDKIMLRKREEVHDEDMIEIACKLLEQDRLLAEAETARNEAEEKASRYLNTGLGHEEEIESLKTLLREFMDVYEEHIGDLDGVWQIKKVTDKITATLEDK